MSDSPGGKKLSKFARGEFVAWDGEGIGRGKKHEYVLLANSALDTLTDITGIPSRDALTMLADGMSAHPHAIHVGFAISYDVNMLLRDVPRSVLRELWDGEETTWTTKGIRFELAYRPRKFFKVKRVSRNRVTGGTWWDVWPFFQSSFVGALEKYNVADEETREAMRVMKARRARFKAKDLRDIAAYNADELKYLVGLMQKLHASLVSAGLTLSRWDGPGAIAAAMLERFNFRATTTAATPDACQYAEQHAYYGGRIECLQYGHTRKTIHHYDINSAYPAAMRTLPCRADGCGRWVYRAHSRGVVYPDHFACWHVRWDFTNQPQPLYPFPWRSANGGVYFPPQGEGLVWTPELLAGVETMHGGMTFHGVWEWVRDRSCHHDVPCAWVNNQYEERQRAKENGDGAEHALKLGLNSAYGKLAQRVGATFSERRGWRTPPYHDLAGAGWITSTVRAQLYRAAMQSPENILMLATDGIFSLVPLDLDVSPTKALGAWSYEKHTGATIVQSGVYFLHSGVGRDIAYDIYSRGFDMESLDIDAIKAAWRKRAPTLSASHERFIGLGAALSGLSRFPLWRTWHRQPRALALHPWGTKRTPYLLSDGRTTGDASRRLLRTTASRTNALWSDPIGGRGMMTTPSSVPWRDDDGTLGRMEQIDNHERAEHEHEDSWM